MSDSKEVKLDKRFLNFTLIFLFATIFAAAMSPTIDWYESVTTLIIVGLTLVFLVLRFLYGAFMLWLDSTIRLPTKKSVMKQKGP